MTCGQVDEVRSLLSLVSLISYGSHAPYTSLSRLLLAFLTGSMEKPGADTQTQTQTGCVPFGIEALWTPGADAFFAPQDRFMSPILR